MPLAKPIRLVMMAALAGLGVAPHCRGASTLLQYEFQGQPGTETTLAPSFTTAGLTGLSFTESSGLTATAGTNSINASGWNVAGQYYQFGFNVNAGFTATVSQITLSTRSSGTGPGTLNVQESIDGGAFGTVATFAQSGTNYNDQMLNLAATLAAKQSIILRIVVANQTSAGTGTGTPGPIGSGGTFRVGDYNPATTPANASLTPFTLTGTITPSGGTGPAPGAVPEPASLAMCGVGIAFAATAGVRARRRAG